MNEICNPFENRILEICVWLVLFDGFYIFSFCNFHPLILAPYFRRWWNFDGWLKLATYFKVESLRIVLFDGFFLYRLFFDVVVSSFRNINTFNLYDCSILGNIMNTGLVTMVCIFFPQFRPETSNSPAKPAQLQKKRSFSCNTSKMWYYFSVLYF